MAVDAEGRQVKTPEGYEKDEICKYLEALDNTWFCRIFMAGFGKSGMPDIAACIDGQFWGIEVKREGKVPTTLQTLRMQAIEAAGGKTAWGTAAKVIPEIATWLQMDSK
jgi:hypothetical protein